MQFPERIHFINCIKAIEYAPYPFQQTPLTCRFVNCNFEITEQNNLYDLGYEPDAFMTLNQVTGAPIMGCDFVNNDITHLTSNRGYGIKSYDSKFFITPWLLTDECSFSNLDYGVAASNTNPLLNFTVRNANFSNNFRAIRATGINNSIISDNLIDVGSNKGGGQSGPLHKFDSYGIYLEGCKGYLVQNNQCSTTHQANYGFIIANSGSLENTINNNSLSNFQYAIQIEGRNGQGPDIWGLPNVSNGLVVKCNEFANNGFCDIGLTNFGASTIPPIGNIIQGIVKHEQGYCSGDTKTPAGNTLSASCLYNLYAATGVAPYIYSYHDPSESNFISTNSPLITLNPCAIAYNSASCALPEPSAISEVSEIITNRSMLIDSLAGLFDGGNTQDLLDIVLNSNNSSQDIHDAIMTASPYVTDTVLVAAIQSEQLTPGHIKDVVVANSPVTENVWDELTKTSLPPGTRKLILEAQDGTSARSILEEELSIYQSELTFATDELLRYFLNDTSGAGTDSIIAFFSTTEMPRSKEILAQAYLSKDDCSSAQAVLSQIPQTTSEEKQFVKYYSILADLCASGTSIDSLSGTQIAELNEIAASGAMVSVNARIVLARLADSTITETIEDIIIGDTMSIRGWLHESTDCGSGPVDGDTLVIKDIKGNTMKVTPVVTDQTGWFSFNSKELANLPLDKYCIASKSSFTIDSMNYYTVADWLQNSPVQLEQTSVMQVWQSGYNTQDSLFASGQAMVIEGSIYSLGTVTTSSSARQLVVVKHDPIGNIIWSTQFNGGYYGKERAAGFFVDTLQYIYCVATDSSSPDYVLTKLDSNGVVLWSKRNTVATSSAYVKEITGDNSGHLYIHGRSRSSGQTQKVFTDQCDTAGSIIWRYAQELSGANLISGGIAILPSHNFVTCAVDTLSKPGRTMVTILNPYGETISSGVIPEIKVNVVSSDLSGNIYVSGNGDLEQTTVLMRFDSTLIKIWGLVDFGYTNTWDNGNMAIDSLGNIILLTQTYKGFYLSKHAPDGTLLWKRQNDGGWYHIINLLDMTMDRFGNVYITATDEFKEEVFMDYVYLFKYDTDGNLVWSTQLPRSTAADVTVSENLNVYITGTKLTYPNNTPPPTYSLYTNKYSQCFSAIILRAAEFSDNPNQQQADYYLNLYPNPNNGSMTIEYNIPLEEQGVFEIYDQTGRVIYSKRLESGTQSIRLQTEGLKCGVYFYRALTSVRSLVNDRVVIIKVCVRGTASFPEKPGLLFLPGQKFVQLICWPVGDD